MTIDNNRLRGIGLYIGDKTSYYVHYCVYIVTPGFHFTYYWWFNMFTSTIINILFQETVKCEIWHFDQQTRLTEVPFLSR